MPQSLSSKTVAISGSHGFIGGALSTFLNEMGHKVVPLIRNRAPTQNPDVFHWWPGGHVEMEKLRSIDSIIHLAGESLFSLWTPSKKKEIRNSRVQGTGTLVDALLALPPEERPDDFFCASAVGFYGQTGEQQVAEDAPPGAGFLAEVCLEWESQAFRLHRHVDRVVNLRFGMVLGENGGLLAKLLPAARKGFLPQVGKGQQYLSWISLVDLVEAVEFLLNKQAIEGPVNMTAPQSVTLDHFNQAVEKLYGKGWHLRIPEVLTSMLPGRMGEELLLASTRAQPTKLQRAGYVFTFPTIESALARVEQGGFESLTAQA